MRDYKLYLKTERRAKPSSVNLTLTALEQTRLEWLRRGATASTLEAVLHALELRRHPILLTFVRQAVEELTDEAIELFDRYLGVIHSRALREAQELWLAAARSTSGRPNWKRDSPGWTRA